VTRQEKIREGLERFYEAGNLTPVNVLFFLERRGVVLKGKSLGSSHPHLAAYYTIESLVEEVNDGNTFIQDAMG